MNSQGPLIRAAAAALALALGAFALTSCRAPALHGARTADGRVTVIAAFYPLQFLAERIGGRRVAVQTLTKPGTEPHDLELSPRQTGELSDAGLIVYLRGLQPAVDAAVAQSGAKHVADAASYTTLEKHGTDVHGERGRAATTRERAGEGSAAADPHIWLDPVRYAQIAAGVGRALAKADPAHRAYYRQRTARLVARLHGLDQDFRRGLAEKKRTSFITTHAAFGYLAERYGLHEEGITGVDPESEPSAERMRQLQRAARADGVRTIFFEENASNSTAKALAQDLHLQTGVLSPLETVNHPATEDYLSVMHRNLRALQQALGAR